MCWVSLCFFMDFVFLGNRRRGLRVQGIKIGPGDEAWAWGDAVPPASGVLCGDRLLQECT